MLLQASSNFLTTCLHAYMLCRLACSTPPTCTSSKQSVSSKEEGSVEEGRVECCCMLLQASGSKQPVSSKEEGRVEEGRVECCCMLLQAAYLPLAYHRLATYH